MYVQSLTIEKPSNLFNSGYKKTKGPKTRSIKLSQTEGGYYYYLRTEHFIYESIL
jgi:hypothetical protein